MKKILCLCAMLGISTLIFGQTATWNGSVSDSWHNAANWTWSNGTTGIPGASTDIVLDTPSNLSLVLQPTDSVSCKNIRLSGGITMNNFSVLNVYGDSIAVGQSTSSGASIVGIDPFATVPGQHAKINFFGNNNKVISGVEIMIGKINIACNSLTLLNEASLSVQTAIKFSQPTVALGNAATGNLIVSATGRCIVSPTTTFQFSTFTPGSQIPPHIIATAVITATTDDFYGMVIILDFLNGIGLNGQITLPIGASTKSYTPMTINHTGDYPWCVSVRKGLPGTCTNTPVVNNNAVQNVYSIFPIDMAQERLATMLDTPAAISLTFNRSATGEDVLTGFNIGNNPLKMYTMDFVGCHQIISGSTETSTSGNQQVTMNIAQQNNFGYFIIAPHASTSIRKRASEMAFQLFPNPVSAHCTFRMEVGHPAVELKLINILGQTLWNKSFEANSLQHGYSLPMETLPKGVYNLQVQSETTHTSQKIVKQ
ncbi:T9SS type A sorting domain-containing protein [Taibaiella sp. KBW10]|uniref:T9SS type A sorting domain-containing protein n=1 Tax=Taibaiella sp. KBW10 TaxID=2153357 RepID=UPI001315926F|nr:T9SS type A sorting domain-containing protein [Taibaiella sp. KBW10]